MSVNVTIRPWFTNDRGEQVWHVDRADGRAIGWYAPHPCGFYGERDSWPTGTVATTKATEASMLEWIGVSTG